MKRSFRRIAYSLLPLLLLVLGGETLLRLIGWPPTRGDRPFEHSEPFWLTDPDLRDHALAHREMNTSFLVSTDSQGLRAPLHELEKPAGALRVLFLGCSTTFGWGVGDTESYPAVVQELLRERGREEVQVINGGQPGYTSFQGLWLFGETLQRYRADLVVFAYIVQDARRAAYTDRSQAMIQRDARFLKDHLLYRFSLYLGARSLIDHVRIRAKERESEGSTAEGTYRVPPEDYVANVREMKRLVEESGGKMALFGFPLEREGYTRDHRRLLRIAAEELVLPHLDPQAQMETESRQRSLYFERDKGHANAEGNRQIGRWVFDWLLGERLLDSPVGGGS